MDLEAKIKEEHAWLEGKTTASLENLEHVPEVIALKEEVNSELTEPESSQENSLEPFEDIKEEIFIEEHTDDQLLPYIKEETNNTFPRSLQFPRCRNFVPEEFFYMSLKLWLTYLSTFEYHRTEPGLKLPTWARRASDFTV
ncbi:uncharacterized protein [Anabrus simplex]|uniref:uncharacterized protein n=1 Tax=Anabrus simplex TaxID=316456 RepID=UPI0035A3A163